MNQHSNKSKKLNEEAAAGSVGGDAVANTVGRLFTGVKQITKQKAPRGPKSIPVIKYSNKKVSEAARISFSAFLAEADEDKFDSADVISKLSQNSKIADDLDGDELAVFGMESDDGAITKVYIPKDQAKEFERALADRLRETKDTTGEEEIASILFDLKDRFKIVDVKWPTVQEDEEQAPKPEADPLADPNASQGDPIADPNADAMADPSVIDGASTADAATGDMITQILDMLRQDAEARKADAEAKIADAHAREADAAQRTAAVKLRGEEEVMDAEAHFKEKKEEKKEAERLKMVARFRQEDKMSQDSENRPAPAFSNDRGRDEDEEAVTITRKTLLDVLRGGR